MKGFQIVILLFLSANIFPQNDDIRIYPSQNHQREISVAIDSTSPNNILAAAIGRSLPDNTVHVAYFYSSVIYLKIQCI